MAAKEITLLERGSLTVTTRRVALPGRTLPVAQISGVRLRKSSGARAASILLGLCASFGAAWLALGGAAGEVALGAIMLAAGAALLVVGFRTPAAYEVYVATAAGEACVFSGHDRREAAEVEEALTRAVFPAP